MATTRRIVLTRFGQVHVRSARGGGTPLVLLHPSARSSDMWEPLQEQAERATFAPDRLGFGFSDAPPWALTMEQYAQSTLEALNGCHIGDSFDVLGVHSGALEAIEIARQAPDRVREVILVGVPLLSKDEAERALNKYGEQTVKPVEDGEHIMAAWRGRFAYRQPPYDLNDAQRRLVEYLLAPNAGADYRAVCGYESERRLKALRQRITVFVPNDEWREQSTRAASLLREGSSFVDLVDQSADLFHKGVARMIALLDQHVPADACEARPLNVVKLNSVETAGVVPAQSAAGSNSGAAAAGGLRAVRDATQGLGADARAVLPGDRASIRPLDEQGALQVLTAEAQLALTEALTGGPGAGAALRAGAGLAQGAPVPGSPGQSTLAPWQNGVLVPSGMLEQRAASALLAVWLDALGALEAAPFGAGAGAGAAPGTSLVAAQSGVSLEVLEGVLQAAIARAVDIVAAWRDTPLSLAQALGTGAAIATSVIRDEFGAPMLLRPEWAGLAPQIRELRRRRRRSALKALWRREFEQGDRRASDRRGGERRALDRRTGEPLKDRDF